MLERIEADRKKDLIKIEFIGLGDADQTLEFYVPRKDRNR